MDDFLPVKGVPIELWKPGFYELYSFQQNVQPSPATLSILCGIHRLKEPVPPHEGFRVALLSLQLVPKNLGAIFPLALLEPAPMPSNSSLVWLFFSLMISCMLISKNSDLFIRGRIQKRVVAKLCEVFIHISRSWNLILKSSDSHPSLNNSTVLVINYWNFFWAGLYVYHQFHSASDQSINRQWFRAQLASLRQLRRIRLSCLSVDIFSN